MGRCRTPSRTIPENLSILRPPCAEQWPTFCPYIPPLHWLQPLWAVAKCVMCLDNSDVIRYPAIKGPAVTSRGASRHQLPGCVIHSGGKNHAAGSRKGCTFLLITQQWLHGSRPNFHRVFPTWIASYRCNKIQLLGKVGYTF